MENYFRQMVENLYLAYKKESQGAGEIPKSHELCFETSERSVLVKRQALIQLCEQPSQQNGPVLLEL